MRYLIVAAIAAASCSASYLTVSDLRVERVYGTYFYGGPVPVYRDVFYGTVVSTAPVVLYGYADAYMGIPGRWWFPGIGPGQTYSGLLATTEYIPVGEPTTGVMAHFSSLRTIPSFIQPLIFDELVLGRPVDPDPAGRPSSAPASAVPEPGSAVLVLPLALLLYRRLAANRQASP